MFSFIATNEPPFPVVHLILFHLVIKLFSVFCCFFFSRSFFSFCCFFCGSFFSKRTDRKAYSVLLFVDFDYFNLNLVAYRQNLSNIVDTLCGNLADMDKTVNTGDDLSKCTERSDAYYCNVNNIAFVEFCRELDPGVVLILLAAERYSLLFGIEALNIYIELVTDLNYLSGVLDSAPGKLA